MQRCPRHQKKERCGTMAKQTPHMIRFKNSCNRGTAWKGQQTKKKTKQKKQQNKTTTKKNTGALERGRELTCFSFAQKLAFNSNAAPNYKHMFYAHKHYTEHL